ncbi:MAG: hypothetical protein DGJ47_000496 [Rickettsiaceae bacterium]
MEKAYDSLNEIKLIGLSTRTSNIAESDPSSAKIGDTIMQYIKENIGSKIVNNKNPGILYCAYTNYENDEHGEYTYFVGEEVTSFDNQRVELEKLVIPKQEYVKFTVGPGAMPDVCINAWQQVWSLNEKDFGGSRNYIADFEIYDHRAKDPSNTVFDLYIGINKSK